MGGAFNNRRCPLTGGAGQGGKFFLKAKASPAELRVLICLGRSGRLSRIIRNKFSTHVGVLVGVPWSPGPRVLGS